MDRELQEYLDRGGTITQCPAIETLPQNGQKKENKKRRPDDICKQCRHKKRCRSLCAPLEWIDGNVELQEKLLNNPYDDRHCTEDYNAVLARVIKNVNQNNNNIILQIRSLRDTRLKAIAAMVHAEMSVSSIAEIVHISKSHVYKTLRNATLNSCESGE